MYLYTLHGDFSNTFECHVVNASFLKYTILKYTNKSELKNLLISKNLGKCLITFIYY